MSLETHKYVVLMSALTQPYWGLLLYVQGVTVLSFVNRCMCLSAQSTFERSRRSVLDRSPGTSSAMWRTQQHGWTRLTASSSCTALSFALNRSAWQVCNALPASCFWHEPLANGIINHKCHADYILITPHVNHRSIEHQRSLLAIVLDGFSLSNSLIFT